MTLSNPESIDKTDREIINKILRDYHPNNRELDQISKVNLIRSRLNAIGYNKYIYNSPIGYFTYELDDNNLIYDVTFMKKIKLYNGYDENQALLSVLNYLYKIQNELSNHLIKDN